MTVDLIAGRIRSPRKWEEFRNVPPAPRPSQAYSGRIFTPAVKDKSFVADITKDQEDYRRTTRLQGGYWQCSFTLVKPLNELVEIYNTWLDYHYEESVGSNVTWEGSIYEMTLNTGNASRTRTLDEVYNHVRAKYGTSSITAETYAQASLDRYGRREAIVEAGDIDSTAATALRDTYLKEHSWPWGRPQAKMQEAEATLDVLACGYVFKMNYRHTTTASGATSDIGTWINAILDTDCTDFIVKGGIAANSTSIKKSVDDYTRCWDLINKLCGLGDASGNLYRAYVLNGRRFGYEQIRKTPRYFILNGQVVDSIGGAALNPFLVQPGVMRDMDWPISTQSPGSYFDDVRDMLIEEISVGGNSGLSWRALDFSESDLLAQFQEYMAAAKVKIPNPKRKKTKKKGEKKPA